MNSSNPADYANLPAGIPPPGVIPNFDHAQSRATQAHIGMGICIGITMIFVTLRVCVKLAVTHQWGWDDWACIFGFLTTVFLLPSWALASGSERIYGIFEPQVLRSGIFKHSSLAAVNLYAASAFFVKLSLFLLYLHLFKPRKITRWLIYGGIIVCGLFYSASIISNCAMCIPGPDQPNDLVTWLSKQKACNLPSVQLAIVQGVFGALSDIYILVIPIESVFQLQLPTSRKIGVSAVFMTGTIAIACSLGSLSYRIKLLHTNDPTWLSIPVFTFSAAEMSAGIICGCMPILAALFRHHHRHQTTWKKFAFPSLRYFSSSRNSRKPIFSSSSDDKTHSPRKLHPTSSEQELSHPSLELESV